MSTSSSSKKEKSSSRQKSHSGSQGRTKERTKKGEKSDSKKKQSQDRKRSRTSSSSKSQSSSDTPSKSGSSASLSSNKISTSSQSAPANPNAASGSSTPLLNASGIPLPLVPHTTFLTPDFFTVSHTPKQIHEIQTFISSESQSAALINDKMRKLVREVLPDDEFSPLAEQVLMMIADEFISSVTSFACSLAKHRKSDTLDICDLQLHLEQNWNIKVPGFTSEQLPSKSPTLAPSPPLPISNHQKRLAIIQKHKSAKKKRRR